MQAQRRIKSVDSYNTEDWSGSSLHNSDHVSNKTSFEDEPFKHFKVNMHLYNMVCQSLEHEEIRYAHRTKKLELKKQGLKQKYRDELNMLKSKKIVTRNRNRNNKSLDDKFPLVFPSIYIYIYIYIECFTSLFSVHFF